MGYFDTWGSLSRFHLSLMPFFLSICKPVGGILRIGTILAWLLGRFGSLLSLIRLAWKTSRMPHLPAVEGHVAFLLFSRTVAIQKNKKRPKKEEIRKTRMKERQKNKERKEK